jgi:hypothetical protein
MTSKIVLTQTVHTSDFLSQIYFALNPINVLHVDSHGKIQRHFKREQNRSLVMFTCDGEPKNAQIVQYEYPKRVDVNMLPVLTAVINFVGTVQILGNDMTTTNAK